MSIIFGRNRIILDLEGTLLFIFVNCKVLGDLGVGGDMEKQLVFMIAPPISGSEIGWRLVGLGVQDSSSRLGELPCCKALGIHVSI